MGIKRHLPLSGRSRERLSSLMNNISFINFRLLCKYLQSGCYKKNSFSILPTSLFSKIYQQTNIKDHIKTYRLDEHFQISKNKIDVGLSSTYLDCLSQILFRSSLESTSHIRNHIFSVMHSFTFHSANFYFSIIFSCMILIAKATNSITWLIY